MEHARTPGRWIPWIIIAFFASFMALLSGFAWIAFHTYTGEVTTDAYKKGLVYNAAIASMDAQEKLGWKGEITMQPHGDTMDILFSLKDNSGQPLNDAQVVARITRPSQAGHDVKLPLILDNKGGYHGMARLPWHGVWDIRVSATRSNDHYQQSKTLILP